MTAVWTVSSHARQRAGEMGVAIDDVLAAVEEPEIEYRSDPRDYPGCRVAVRGRIAVPHDPETRTIITVLWHQEEGR